MVEQHSEAIEMDVEETSESTTAAADSMITERKRMPLIPFRMSRLAPASPRDVMTLIAQRQRGRKVPDPTGGTGGRGPQSEVLGRVERGFDFLGEASHRHCATHCACACRHVALETLSHRSLLHCSRQLFARPPPWAATAGNENCIATRMASAASVYLVM